MEKIWGNLLGSLNTGVQSHAIVEGEGECIKDIYVEKLCAVFSMLDMIYGLKNRFQIGLVN